MNYRYKYARTITGNIDDIWILGYVIENKLYIVKYTWLVRERFNGVYVTDTHEIEISGGNIKCVGTEEFSNYKVLYTHNLLNENRIDTSRLLLMIGDVSVAVFILNGYVRCFIDKNTIDNYRFDHEINIIDVELLNKVNKIRKRQALLGSTNEYFTLDGINDFSKELLNRQFYIGKLLEKYNICGGQIQSRHRVDVKDLAMYMAGFDIYPERVHEIVIPGEKESYFVDWSNSQISFIDGIIKADSDKSIKIDLGDSNVYFGRGFLTENALRILNGSRHRFDYVVHATFVTSNTKTLERLLDIKEKLENGNNRKYILKVIRS